MLKKTSLRIILFLLLALPVTFAAAQPVAADSAKLTLASALPPKSNLEIAAKLYADNITEKTGDRVK